jgi:penicillin amidase
MKWLKIGLALVIIVVIAIVVIFPRLNQFQREGEIVLAGLKAPVKVIRDEKGMAYIYAENEDDLLRAQGFVTAQDRMFQMQLIRLLATGRISELVGEKGKNADITMRTIGFYRQAQRHGKILNDRNRRFFQSYLDGVNAFIKNGSDLPLEFKLAGIKPETWTIADSLAVAYFMGWNSAANLQTEIIAQMLVEKLGPDRAREIFPLNINPDDPTTTERGSKSSMRPERLNLNLMGDQKLMALLGPENQTLRAGSNNWVVGPTLSPSGKPIVANDPHLDSRILPGPWYPTGLITPAWRAVGVTIPGLPGMTIGRTDRIALGVTNSYGDAQDLYVEAIDPKNPGNYLEGQRSVPFQTLEETLRIKDKKAPQGFREERLMIRLTKRGPVVSDVLPGLKTDKVITVRWSPFETMGASMGLDQVLKARSASEVQEALRETTAVMLNFVFADVDGHFGWQTSGRLPIRSHGDGTVPVLVTDDRDNWTGWIPLEKMPQLYDPPRGWVGTCNHKTVLDAYPYYYSSYFSPSYRYRRLMQLLDKPGKKSVDDHWQFQRDTLNLMAREVAPVMAKALLAHKDTEAMGKILSKWDCQDSADQPAPAIFQAVYRKFALAVFQDELGEDLVQLMLADWYFWEERLAKMVREGDSPWFDDQGTPAKRETMKDLFYRAALEAGQELSSQYGTSPEDWRWSKIHQLEFLSPIRQEGAGKGLLGGGSHPMGGSGETLYRAAFDFKKPFGVKWSASLRMVADLGDDDKVLAVLPGGVSGRLFDRHYKGQIEPFMKGEKRYWWFSDREIKNHAQTQLLLTPH